MRALFEEIKLKIEQLRNDTKRSKFKLNRSVRREKKICTKKEKTYMVLRILGRSSDYIF
jgi:hypothetical protein